MRTFCAVILLRIFSPCFGRNPLDRVYCTLHPANHKDVPCASRHADAHDCHLRRTRCRQDAMNAKATSWPARFRNGFAALMALVIAVMSFAVATSGPALASSTKGRVAAEITKPRTSPAKPCQKTVLPGTVNTCPLSSFCFSFIPGGSADCAVSTQVATALWRLSDSSLRTQCCDLSPYRPPRSAA